jgi:hypothetical protein
MQSTDTRPTGELQETRITRVSSSSIRPGMEVSSFGGDLLGSVRAVEENHLVIQRPWLGDARVPLERVLTVGRESLILTRLRQPPSPRSVSSTPANAMVMRLVRRLRCLVLHCRSLRTRARTLVALRSLRQPLANRSRSVYVLWQR